MSRSKALLFVIFQLLFIYVNGQNGFTVTPKRGCVPFTVNVTNVSGYTQTYYFYDFENVPTQYTNNFSNTYTTPGKYVILQKVQLSSGFLNPYDYDTVYALDPNHQAQFSMDLCANYQIIVSITDTVYDSFDIDYGDGTIVSVAKGNHNHTYASSATRTVSVTGKYVECTGATTTQTVTPILALLPPDVTDLTVTSQSSSSSVLVRYSPLAGRHYALDQKTNGGAFIAIDTIHATAGGVTGYIVPNLNTLSNLYSFQLRNIDMCASTPSAPSVVLHSILVNPVAVSGQNQISWQTQGVFASSVLKRNIATISTTPVSPYTDLDVVCPEPYCYQLVGTYATISSATGDPHKTYSASPCVNAIFVQTLPAITINSGYENERVVAKWEAPASAFQYTLNLIGSTTTTTTLTTNQYSESPSGHCFSVTYSDNCGNTSAVSATTCPMVLSMTKTEETVFLSWTPYDGYDATGFASYMVEVLDAGGNIISSQNVGSLLTYQEVPNPNFALFRYRVKAISNGTETMVSYSNVMEVDLSPQLHMPNTFTPNGDGVNDSFVPKGKYFTNFKLTVFNKWGEVIFVTNDALAGWDGTYKNEPVSLDTYSYFVQAESNGGEKIAKRGVVTVLR